MNTNPYMWICYGGNLKKLILVIFSLEKFHYVVSGSTWIVFLLLLNTGCTFFFCIIFKFHFNYTYFNNFCMTMLYPGLLWWIYSIYNNEWVRRHGWAVIWKVFTSWNNFYYGTINIRMSYIIIIYPAIGLFSVIINGFK